MSRVWLIVMWNVRNKNKKNNKNIIKALFDVVKSNCLNLCCLKFGANKIKAKIQEIKK